jgi:FtsP/CotA-like multicopper oxidase with cupredoxin domain
MPLEHGRSHVEDGMSGLVIGVSVRPRTGDVALQSDPPSQRVRVIAQRHAGFYGKRDGYGYVMQDGNTPPASDSIRVPGAPIVVTRSVPVAVTVVNHLTEATAVHWHGIEIESFYDGVPGWSGAGARVAPMIAPGDSFVARFTPRRAGTFMYHTHHDDARQMELGLYAPLIVLEPGEQWDSTTDHVLMIGGAFEKDRYVVALNGSTAPAPLDLRADVPHRFRIINVTIDEMADVTFFASADSADSSVTSWRAIAKDGATLPERMQTVGPARLHLGPGEIYDFEVTPRAGDARIVVQSSNTSSVLVRAR